MEEQCWREFEFDADVHPTATTWPNVAAIDSAHFRTCIYGEMTKSIACGARLCTRSVRYNENS